jgi:hypothetical protein
MPSPLRPVTRKDVNRFTSICIPLRACWQHYQIIFDVSPLQRELLQQTAYQFFYDLNTMLRDRMILEICKLTDEEWTGKFRNLTTQFLLANADFSGDPTDYKNLQRLTARMDKFRLCILPARNKMLGHIDLETAHGRKSLGKASNAAWRQFWLDLRDFLANCTNGTLIKKLRSISSKLGVCLIRINL